MSGFWIRRFALCFVTSVAMSFAGCSSDEPPPELEVETLEEIELTSYARLPESDGALTSVEVFENRLIFHYSGAPTIALEAEHVVSGIQDGGYLRRLISVTTLPDGSVEAETEPAELGELIGKGHFIITHRPGTPQWREVDDDVSGRIDALDGEGGAKFVPPWPTGARGLSCGAGAASGLGLKPEFNMNPTFVVEVNMDWGWGRRWGVPYPRGVLKSAKFIMGGAMTIGATLTGEVTGNASCSLNILEAIAGDAVPKWESATTFAVGPVPVVLTHEIAPTLGLELGVSGNVADFTGRARGTIGFEAGATYDGSRWRRVWEPESNGTTSLNVEGRQDGNFKIELKLSGGIEYKGKIYDAAGPSASLGPALSGTFEGNLSECTWKAEAKLGLVGQIAAILEIPIIDRSIASVEYALTIAERPIAEREGEFPWCDEPEMCGDGMCGAMEDATSCPADCDMGGGPVCGDGTCDSGETTASCASDCPATMPSCGDGSCNGSETEATCAADCGSGGTAWCGDGACDPTETPADCAADCDTATGGDGPRCGDGACNGSETEMSCAADCDSGSTMPTCGDGACNGAENTTTCASDCPAVAPVCGDDDCNGSETIASCAADCGSGGDEAWCGDGACDATESEVDCAADCDSGLIGVACGDGACNGSETPMDCAADCGSGASCGDGVCNSSESEVDCAADCVGGRPICGDAECNGSETASDCAADCVDGSTPACGDGACNGAETTASCEADCGVASSCGDMVCAIDETPESCPSDCTEDGPSCGDTICMEDAGETQETCPTDCGHLPEENPCDMGDSCSSCNDITGCGWCAGTNTCIPSGEGESCPAADWLDNRNGCYDCSVHSACSDCVNDAYCGYCPGMGCINNTQNRLKAMCSTYLRYGQRMMCGG